MGKNSSPVGDLARSQSNYSLKRSSSYFTAYKMHCGITEWINLEDGLVKQ